MKLKHFIKAAALLGVFLVAITSCQKDNYYNDGGLSKQSQAELQMSTYDFLASRNYHVFDSLLKIVDLTNSKDLLNQDNITVYAMPNTAVIRFQSLFNPDDRQQPRLLSRIGVDTLRMLLNRLIIPNNKTFLDNTVVANGVNDYRTYYKDNNGDSIVMHGISGITTPGSLVRTGADRMEYEHRKKPGVDTSNYRVGIQVHNLRTKNAVVHILYNGSSFATGFKTPYIR